MTTTMNNREKMLLIMLFNIALLAILYLIIFKSFSAEQMANLARIQELNDKMTTSAIELANYDSYTNRIQELLEERRKLYNHCFPSAPTERIHAFISGQLQDAKLKLDSIQVTSEQPFFAEGATSSAIFNNNFASLQLTGTYDNILKFITEFEAMDRTHQFANFSLNPSGEGFSCSTNLNLFTVEKDVPDDTFDLLPFKGIFYLGMNDSRKSKTLNFRDEMLGAGGAKIVSEDTASSASSESGGLTE